MPRGAKEDGVSDDAKLAKNRPDKEFMTTLAKGLAVIRAFGTERPRMTLSQAAAAVSLSRATARRVLLTLNELGYVEQDGRDFRLAPRVMELGFSYLAAQNWIERVSPLLKALSEEIDETCSASVLQGDQIVYVTRVQTSRIMTSAVAIGARLPAWHTAMGRILLASLPIEERRRRLRPAQIAAYTPSTITERRALLERVAEDGERGFSIVDEELERGLRSISVALTSRGQRLIGAIEVSAHANRTTRNEMRDRFLPRLREIARQITQSAEQ
jgi:IclR family pca regulon transcriptional regulator